MEYGKHPCSSKSQNYTKRNIQRNVTSIPSPILTLPHPLPPICADNQLNISFWIHPSCISCRSEKAHVYSYTLFFLTWKTTCYRYSFALCFFRLDNISWQSLQVISWNSSSFFFLIASQFPTVWIYHQLSSVQSRRSVVSDSLWPHGLQIARPPCPSPTSWSLLKLIPSHQWCHPTISSSVAPFSSHLQSFPASGSFPISWFFTSGGQSIGVSASTSVLPMKIEYWFPLGLTG